jgi:hypothetical protein
MTATATATPATASASSPSPFREYAEDIRMVPPRALLNDLHVVSSTIRYFWLKTLHDLESVLRPGYFNSIADLRLRPDDLIQVVAGNSPAQHALIVVDDANKSGGDVVVSLLQRYERAGK